MQLYRKAEMRKQLRSAEPDQLTRCSSPVLQPLMRPSTADVRSIFLQSGSGFQSRNWTSLSFYSFMMIH